MTMPTRRLISLVLAQRDASAKQTLATAQDRLMKRAAAAAAQSAAIVREAAVEMDDPVVAGLAFAAWQGGATVRLAETRHALAAANAVVATALEQLAEVKRNQIGVDAMRARQDREAARQAQRRDPLLALMCQPRDLNR
jgi:hypothetical protein